MARFRVEVEGVMVDGLPSRICQRCGFTGKVVEAEERILIPGTAITGVDVGRCFGGNGDGVVGVRQRGLVRTILGDGRRSDLLEVWPSVCIRCRKGEEADFPPEDLRVVNRGPCFVEIV